MNEITIESCLTDRQYRKYMNFHVLGSRSDVAKHCIISVLIVIFGMINFRTGSPVLGWIFVTLGLYVFVSRFIRFYMSVNRIIHEFGLSQEPKFFYMIRFSSGGAGSSADTFHVKNATESADYPLEKVYHAYFREKEQIVYLYLTKANAFLLPYASFTRGTPGDLKELLSQKCGDHKVTVYEDK